MRIAIDGHTLEIDKWSGKEQYLFSLLKSLLKLKTADKFLLYLRHPVPAIKNLNFSNLIIRQKKLPTPLWHFWALFDFKKTQAEKLLAPCSYLISAINFLIPEIIVIHDLTSFLKESRNTHKLSLKIKEYLSLYLSCLKTETIISLSENTKKDITRIFKINPAKIKTIYQGHRFSREIATRKEKPNPIIISVGTIEPRKNIPTIIKAFELLKARRTDVPWKLLIIGKIGWKAEESVLAIKKSLYADDIELRGYIDNQELSVIYSSSLCLVYPSLYEGFGLPPLEAMFFGCPAIVSDNSSLPEVVGESGLKVACLDYQKISKIIESLWDNPDLRKKIEISGNEQAKKFNWDVAAEKTINAIKNKN
jgi:glycosyltransferase involved in cell wall biosynthesis